MESRLGGGSQGEAGVEEGEAGARVMAAGTRWASLGVRLLSPASVSAASASVDSADRGLKILGEEIASVMDINRLGFFFPSLFPKQ